MGFLKRLKETATAKLSPDARFQDLPTEPTGGPPQDIHTASKLLRQIQVTADLISNTAASERGAAASSMEALRRQFDSLSLEARRAAALADAQPIDIKRPATGNKKPAPCWPVVLSDLERPGKFTARRYGNRSVVGRGDDEIDALDDLERLEANGDRKGNTLSLPQERIADAQTDIWFEA
jgi:hypothetical protein